MNRGIVYFHFDSHHQVRDYVVHALASLRPHAEHILVVSNSPVDDAGRARLEASCDEILERPNAGLDVGAYRAGLEHLGWDRLADFDELILTNHTYYAPLRPWEEVLTRTGSRRDISFWGMTEHGVMRPHPFLAKRELPRHIQSHWIAVRRRLLADPAFREYWEQMPPVSSYRDSIQWHESRFTDHFTGIGHTYEVAFPVDRYHSDNPAIEEAPALLADGCPLLKRRAFFHDPLHQDRQAVVGGDLLEAAAQAGYSEDLILSDVVHTAAARDLIVNAGLTEVVTESAPGTSSPAQQPSGCVVVHVPAAGEGIERAEADGLAQRLACLPAHWRVVVTSPEPLDADDLERVTGRRPADEDGAAGDTAVAFRAVRDLDPRGTIAFLTECDDLWDPGRPVGSSGEGIGDDSDEVAGLAARVYQSGLLDKCGLDPHGVGAILDAMLEYGVPEDAVVGVSQGWKLGAAIKTAERKLAEGCFIHNGSAMMNWVVGNARVEPRANGILITKQASGSAKIDPLMAMFNAVSLLSLFQHTAA